MRRVRSCLIAAAVMTASLAPITAAAQSADFAAARSLYASASYEEALARLAVVKAAEDAVQVEQYRALCLVALGRITEAEQALERLVAANPLYVMRETDVSPRLITMFRDVRKRALPVEARARYTRAKTAYDEKQFDAAVQQFKDLVAILGDPDVSAETNLADLKMLGEGFLKLADAEAKAAAAAAAAATKPQPPADAPAPPVPSASSASSVPSASSASSVTSASSAPSASSVAPVYSADDKDVTPPADLVRKMPAWEPPLPAMRKMYFRGVLEVVIDESGAVTEATMRQPVTPHYDPQLLAAAKEWKFEPATRDGKPVKYRKLIEIVLQPATN